MDKVMKLSFPKPFYIFSIFGRTCRQIFPGCWCVFACLVLQFTLNWIQIAFILLPAIGWRRVASVPFVSHVCVSLPQLPGSLRSATCPSLVTNLALAEPLDVSWVRHDRKDPTNFLKFIQITYDLSHEIIYVIVIVWLIFQLQRKFDFLSQIFKIVP